MLHKNIICTKLFPRIKSILNKGFFIIDKNGIFKNKIYFNGHYVGYENKITNATILSWEEIKNAGYMDLNTQ